MVPAFVLALIAFDCIEPTPGMAAEAPGLRFFKEGNRLSSTGKYALAIAQYKQAILANPTNIDYRIALTEAFFACKDYKSALIQANAVVQLAPNDARGYKVRARIHKQLKAPRKTIEDATKAIKLDPKDAKMYLLRATAYYFLNEFENNKQLTKPALADINKALELDPKNAQAHYYRGAWLVMEKDFKGAIDCFSKAIECDPKDTNPLRYRSMAYSALKQYDKAGQDLDRVLQISPHSFDAIQARASNFERLGQWQKAFDDYNLALKVHPEKFRIRYSRAAVAMKLKLYGAAKADYDAILNANALDDEALKLRGDCYALMGDNEKALADYNEAIDLSPESAGYYEARSRIHLKMNHTASAKKDAGKAMELRKKPAELSI